MRCFSSEWRGRSTRVLYFAPLLRQRFYCSRTDDKEETRQLVLSLQRDFAVENPSDWKRVSMEEILKRGGREILDRHSCSWLAVLKASNTGDYDGLDEMDVRTRRPSGYWRAAVNKRSFFEGVATKLSITDKDGWNRLTKRGLAAMGGRGLLKECKGSVESALREAFPEEDWSDFGGCQALSNGYWNQRENRRRHLEEFAMRHGIETLSDWKAVTWQTMRGDGLAGMLAHFRTLTELLQDAFPEKGFTVENCRPRLGRGYWQDRGNCKRFLDSVAEEMGIEKPSDWANVTTVHIQERGGSGLLAVYPTFYAALEDAYDQIGGSENLRLFRPKQPSSHWRKPNTIREFLDRVKRELGFDSDDGWYRVSTQQVRDLGGGGMLFSTKTMHNALSIAYPNVKWDAGRFSQTSKRAAQLHLVKSVSAIFPT